MSHAASPSALPDRWIVTAAIAALLFAGACSEVAPITAVTPHSPPVPGSSSAIISANVDLDQQGLLLHYRNNVGAIEDVIPPWGSAVSVHASDNIRFDHFTRDGWVVVYNTFDVSQTNSRPVLILYNKYRGTLRWWWWNDKDPAAGSKYLTYALMIDGSNTSALNNGGEFAKDYNDRNPHPFTVKTNAAQFNDGLVSDSWYYFDTEFAYDPQIAGQPQSSYSLVLNAWATQDSKVQLTGDVTGTINGTISGSGKGVPLLGTLIGSVNQTNVTNSSATAPSGPSADQSFSDKINGAVDGALKTALLKELNDLANTGAKIIGSPLANVFSSIVSSDPTPQQKVQLSLAAKINVTGDITSEVPAVQFAGALPGTSRGDPSGYLPYYNETLGLFSLSEAPVVKWRVATGIYPPAGPGQTDVQYFATPPSLVLNPAVAGEVTVAGPTATLIYLKQYSGNETFSQPNTLSSTALSNFPVLNSVFGNVWYGFSAPYTIRYDWWTGVPEQNIVVQVAFTIIPNNGAPPVDVVKLYRPTYQPY